MPIDSPAACAVLSALSLLAAAALLPRLAPLAAETAPLASLLDGIGGWGWLRAGQRVLQAGAWAGTWIFQARCLQLCHPRYYDAYRASSAPPRSPAGAPGIVVAGMPVSGEDLRTSVLVTGVTGSSKTAGVLLPALARLLETYAGEEGSGRPKLGAFIPEVKGDLVDACIYLAHQAGRCVCRDVVILSPACRIPVARYRDERDRFWRLSARGGAGGSDAGELLPALRYPEGHPCAGAALTAAAFEQPAEAEALLGLLRGRSFALDGRQPRFIGWRWEGGRLWRVGHTESRNRPEPLAGSEGGRQWADPPLRLALDAVEYVDNGVRYNLVDPRLPPAEAAERLTRLAAMARGTASRGENDYFYEQGRKLIAACIALHRATSGAACTASDVVRLATQDERLDAALAALEERLQSGRCPEWERGSLEELGLFFRGEWQKMVADGKTANVIRSTLSAVFGVFLQDPNLAATFCRASTFSFEDTAQSGKIVALVPGDRYEQLGRLLGTACKIDFQSAMLARSGRADLNRERLVLYFADECHKYVVSGSSTAGDPYFMNLSRSNNVVNFCATQSYAWLVEVIGREAANVYISAFGVQFWLQQTDPETCRRAAEICGTVTRDKVSAEHTFDLAGLCSVLAGRGGLAVRRRVTEEERPRFRPEDFAQLDVGEIVAYNKGRPGKLAKVSQGRAEYSFCTRKPDGIAAVRDRVREYYRELLENLAFDRGEAVRWDCGPGLEAPPPAVAPPAAPEGTEAPARPPPIAPPEDLDAAFEALGAAEPLGFALALEEARLRARDSDRPDEAFGLALCLGGHGLASELKPGGAPAAVPVDAEGLPYRGGLAVLAGERARRREARREAARCA